MALAACILATCGETANNALKVNTSLGEIAVFTFFSTVAESPEFSVTDEICSLAIRMNWMGEHRFRVVGIFAITILPNTRKVKRISSRSGFFKKFVVVVL